MYYLHIFFLFKEIKIQKKKKKQNKIHYKNIMHYFLKTFSYFN